MTLAASVLLCALVALSTLTAGTHFAAWARLIGVATGGFFAWRRTPFTVVVLAAAATTAVLRFLGVA